MRRLVLLVAALAGCQHVTEIVVRVTSDLAAGAPFTTSEGNSGTLSQVCFVLQPGFGTPAQAEPDSTLNVPLRTSTDPSGTCLPIDLGIVAKGDWNGDPFGIEVRGMSDCQSDTANYLYARAESSFVDGKVMQLNVALHEPCSVDVSTKPACDPKQRCYLQNGVASCEALAVETAETYMSPPTSACSP